MTTFTLPVISDKVYLVVPKPVVSDSLRNQSAKTLMPFSPQLWYLLIGVIVFTAVLSVWFQDKSLTDLARGDRRMMMRGATGRRFRRRKRVYARLALDSILQKGVYFFSAGVEQDADASLPHKTLMFGFAFFILISVSAYVANLAAFLTLSMVEAPVRTMRDAVMKKVRICIHPVLREEMIVAWPEADFYVHEEGNEFQGVLDDYNAGKCGVMAIGWEDTGTDTAFLENLCASNLMVTDSLVIEMPIGFPIQSHLAAGFSSWMVKGDKFHGITIKNAKKEYLEEISCNYLFEEKAGSQADDYAAVTARNMFFPLMFYLGFVVLAIILQLIHQFMVRRGKESMFARGSTLNLVTDRPALTASLNRPGFNPIRRKRKDEELSSKEDDSLPKEERGEGMLPQVVQLGEGGSRLNKRILLQEEKVEDVEVNGFCDNPLCVSDPQSSGEFLQVASTLNDGKGIRHRTCGNHE